MILYAPDGRPSMFNTAARRILGFDPGAGTVDEIVRQRRVVDGHDAPLDAATDHHRVRWEALRATTLGAPNRSLHEVLRRERHRA